MAMYTGERGKLEGRRKGGRQAEIRQEEHEGHEGRDFGGGGRSYGERQIVERRLRMRGRHRRTECCGYQGSG
jgi:hypothetical protein